MTDILSDRNYLRQLDDDQLIALARDSKTDLAIVLGERLEQPNHDSHNTIYDIITGDNA